MGEKAEGSPPQQASLEEKTVLIKIFAIFNGLTEKVSSVEASHFPFFPNRFEKHFKEKGKSHFYWRPSGLFWEIQVQLAPILPPLYCWQQIFSHQTKHNTQNFGFKKTMNFLNILHATFTICSIQLYLILHTFKDLL